MKLRGIARGVPMIGVFSSIRGASDSPPLVFFCLASCPGFTSIRDLEIYLSRVQKYPKFGLFQVKSIDKSVKSHTIAIYVIDFLQSLA